MQKQAPLRATVDGDARRNRRHSSDESAGGGSVTELDRSRYLQQYQRTTPMQPGMLYIYMSSLMEERQFGEAEMWV